MNDENETKPLVTLPLDYGEEAFYEEEELKSWNDEQKSSFDWLLIVAKEESTINNLATAVTEVHGKVNNFIQQTKQKRGNPEVIENLANNLHNQVDQLNRNKKVLTKESPAYQFAELVRENHDDKTAAYALATLLGHNFNPSSVHALRGAYIAFDYQRGSAETVSAEKSALQSLKNRWSKRFGNEHKKIISERDHRLQELEQAEDAHKNLNKEIQETIENQREKFNEDLENANQRLEEIENAFTERMATQSSVSYWSSKRRHHTIVLWATGVGMVLIGAGTAGAFSKASYELLQQSAMETELWRVGIVLAISSIGIWLTRITGKIFISNLHLRTDADERVTMIQTYLSLLERGEALQENDRKLILETLFRPTSTGYIHDEGPEGPNDTILKTLKNR